jgi:KipI family sensor histidine kinase inhibitor
MLFERPRYLDCGEAALIVEFGDSVDPKIHARVMALDAHLRAAAPAGVIETVPTYRSLTLHYDPLTLSRADLIAAIEAAPAYDESDTSPKSLWRIPCCYDPALGEDIAAAGEILQLTPQRLAALHAGAGYRAYMYGFAPGWCYLGGLPLELKIERRATPRAPTPHGAVLIGGGLSLIGAGPMPTGWYVIGRTPESLFSLERAPPLLIEPGDAVRFEAVDVSTFRDLESRVARGEIVARREDAS